MSNTCLMVVAGERSGDVYGGALARALQGRGRSIEVFGCGGDAMRQAGVETVVDAHTIALIGITEVVTGLPRTWRALRRLTREAARRQPCGAVLIDFPDFNLRLARRLRRLGVPVIYFVSPQVWAWRAGRLKAIRATVQKMLCIFDFEQEIYQQAGIPVEYVGHPLADSAGERSSREGFFAKAGLDMNVPTVALLPGSRLSEVAHHLPRMLEAATEIASRRSVQFLISAAPGVNTAGVESLVGRHGGAKVRLRIIAGAAHDVLEHSTLAIVASGTATLEAALDERPMIVVYRVSPATAWVARRLVRVPFYSMVNLLANQEVVPELIQADFTAKKLGERMEFLLDHPEARERMVEGLRTVKTRLGAGGAIERAAEAVWREIRPGGASRSAA
jgi:lipid-A-disaccharide synthase